MYIIIASIGLAHTVTFTTSLLTALLECLNFDILPTELSALADLMGPYGIRYLGEQLTDLVSSQVKELKVCNYIHTNVNYNLVSTLQKIVISNKEALLNLHMNRDKPEVFNDNLRRLRS